MFIWENKIPIYIKLKFARLKHSIYLLEFPCSLRSDRACTVGTLLTRLVQLCALLVGRVRLIVQGWLCTVDHAWSNFLCDTCELIYMVESDFCTSFSMFCRDIVATNHNMLQRSLGPFLWCLRFFLAILYDMCLFI